MDLLQQFTEYLSSRYNHLSKNTVKNYRADLGKFIKWYEERFGRPLNLDPSFITWQIIDFYRNEKILESNLSNRSFKRHLSSFRKFFEFLKLQGIIPQDPFEQIKKDRALSHNKWRLHAFRNYLYLHNKSHLTVKNYILDMQHFLNWAEKVIGVSDPSDSQEDILTKINQDLVNEYKERLIKFFSPRTINRNLSSIRKYVNWLNQEGLVRKIDPQTKLTREKPQATSQASKRYSPFPPLRVMQKIIRGIDLLFDIIVIASLLKATDIWKSKPLFKEIPNLWPQYPQSGPVLKIGPLRPPRLGEAGSEARNYPKAMYAPLSISIRYFPWHKKVWHHIFHKRPKWYKIYHSYSITHYFHSAILILSMSLLGFTIYQSIIETEDQKSVLPAFATYSPRILSFKGQLTDNLNNPITTASTPLRVAIYNDETAAGSSLLWEEVVSVNPDREGNFVAFLGNSTPISQSLFVENQKLWLGVAIGESPELTPREPIASVSFAGNAQTLQGLPPITSDDAQSKNVVLSLDSSGNLTIGGDANPTFQATGGNFKLLGETLILSTLPGTNSNVEIAPMDLGKIDLQRPIFNNTNNNNIDQAIGAVEIDDMLSVLATSSAQSAFTINQDSTGQLISAYTSSLAKFTVDNNGNIISTPGIKWQPFSDSVSALNIANAAGNTFLSFDTSNSRLRILSDTTERAAVFYQNSDSTFHIRSGSALALDTNNSNTPKVYIATSGNVGIGTVSPLFRLDVQDSQEASAAAQIFNSNSSTDADGLVVKLGTLAAAVDNANHFISFETSGIGIVGSVRGGGGTGVDFRTTGIADFAEYLKKDKDQNIEYGSIICIDEKGLVLPCDTTNNKIVGVASDHGGFTGGKDQKEESIRVGLVGQVYTRVSTINGTIKPGDPLTSSSIFGVAVKALIAGPIVGKALEAFNPNASECISPNISESDEFVCIGKILVAIGVSWFDPDVHLASSADLSRDIRTAEEKNLKDQILGLIQDYIEGSKIISPIAKVDQIESNIISPLPTKHLATISQHASEIQATSSAQPGKVIVNETESSQNEKTASLEAALSGSELVRDTSLSSESTLPQNTYSVNSQNQGQNQGSGPEGNRTHGTIQPSTPLSKYYLNSLSVETATFTQGLISLGPASLSDTSITGQLSIGRSFQLEYNSINVFGADLALQPLRQGGLSIMGDLVYIDTDGNLKVEGNAEFAKEVKVGGDIIASGSGTFSKLNLNLVQKAIAISQTEIIATGSAGLAAIQANQTELTIKNNIVTDKSLIYITPVGTPSSQIPFLMRQIPQESFTVGIQSPNKNENPFNWLIVN